MIQPAETAARADHRLQGILFLCTGALVVVFQNLIIKWASDRHPLPEVMAIRCTVAVAPLLFLAHLDGGLAGLRGRRPGPLALRGVLLLVSYATYYLALAAIPLAEAVSLFYSAPLFIVMLAGPMLGERVGLARWFAVVFGFAGVIVVCRPGRGMVEPAALLATVSAVFYALAQVLARQLGVTDRASAMAFHQNGVFFLAAAAMGVAAGNGGFAGPEHASLAFLLRAWVMPSPDEVLLIGSTGVIAAFASWCLTHAYRIAAANVLAPFEYTSIAWATIGGYLLWGEVPIVSTIIGVLMIVGAGLYVLRATLKS